MQTVRGLTGWAPQAVRGACNYSVSDMFDACEKGDLETLKKCFPHLETLSPNTCFVVRKDDEGRELNLFHLACKHNSLNIVEWLCGNADFNENQLTTGRRQETALSLAIKSGATDVAVYLVRYLRFHLDFITDLGESLLHLAVKNRDIKMFDFLLDEGMDIQAKTHAGKGVLDFACELGDKDLMTTVIDRYTRVLQHKRPSKEPAAELERWRTTLGIFWLRTSTRYEKKAVSALRKNHTAFNITGYMTLKREGAKDKKLEGMIKTPSAMEYAIIHNDIELLALLLKMGADPAQANCHGYTPTQVAVLADNKEALGCLISVKNAGTVSVERQSPPLHIAAHASYDCLRIFLYKDKSRGADLDSRDWRGLCPLDYACHSGQWGHVRLLRAFGADLYSANPTSKKLPVHYAASGGHRHIVEELLQEYDEKFRPDTVPVFHSELIFEAARNDHWELVTWLLKSSKGFSKQRLSNLMDGQNGDVILQLLINANERSKASVEDAKNPPGDESSVLETAIRALPLEKEAKKKKGTKKTKAEQTDIKDKLGKLLAHTKWKGTKPVTSPMSKTVQQDLETSLSSLPSRFPQIIEKAAGRPQTIAFKTVQHEFLGLILRGQKDFLPLFLETPLKSSLLTTPNPDNKFLPLHYAVTCPEPKSMIPYLVEQGAVASQAGGANSVTPLHYALYRSDQQSITCLLDYADAEIANARDSYGDTPLHKAVDENAAATYGVLAIGGDPETQNKKGVSPLSQKNECALTRALLLEAKQVRIKTKKQTGSGAGAAVASAGSFKSAAPVKEGVQERPVSSRLLALHRLLCRSPDLKDVEQQLDQFTADDLSQVLPGSGTNALHLAILVHRDDLVKLLLSKGCDSAIPTAGSATFPLHMAIQNNDPQCTSALMKRGGNHTQKNSLGEPPIQAAWRLDKKPEPGSLLDVVWKNRVHVFKPDATPRLKGKRAAGAQIKETCTTKPYNNERYNNLFRKVICGYPEAEIRCHLMHMDGEELFDLKPENYPHTLLHEAAVRQRADLVRLLLEHGADPAIQTSDQKETILHIAVKNQNLPLLEIILAGIADKKYLKVIALRNKQGKAADDIARDNLRGDHCILNVLTHKRQAAEKTAKRVTFDLP